MDRPLRLSKTICRVQECARHRSSEAIVRVCAGLPASRLTARFPDPERSARSAEGRASEGLLGLRPQRELEDKALARKALDSSRREVGSSGISLAPPPVKHPRATPRQPPASPPPSHGPPQPPP